MRIYSSHEDAINYGTGYAEERVGPEAKLKKSHNPRWKEGLRDATYILGGKQVFSNIILDYYFIIVEY